MHLFLTLLVLISIEVVVVVFATKEAILLGTNAPPATFDGWTMTAVPQLYPARTNSVYVYYSDVEALDPSDPITFGLPLFYYAHTGFAAWTTRYSDVYNTHRIYSPGDRLEIIFPQDTCAFIFYSMPARMSTENTFHIKYASGDIVSKYIPYPGIHEDGAHGFAVSYCKEYGRPVSVTIPLVIHHIYPDHTTWDQHWEVSVGEFSMSQCGADTDGDSIPDLVDNCPNDANLCQSDYDGDGIGDVCDLCVLGANDADRDNDGVPDACDKCPGFDDSQDRDGDGLPDACDPCPDDDNYADIDADGIPDCIDNCVNSPNTDQMDTDGDGIGDVCDDNGACCINDCNGVATGNYQSCISCSVYVTCNHGNKIDNRPCPGGLYWDANIGPVGQGGCRSESSSCDPNQQSIPCPSPP